MFEKLKMQGYLSYLSGAGVIVATGLHAAGYLDDHAYDAILGLLGGTTVIGLRRSLGRNAAALEQVKKSVGSPNPEEPQA